MTLAIDRADLEYPETDGQPMTESDPTRDYLIYSVAALRCFFKSRPNVYVSGNLFIYYEEGNPSKSISPDVFVIFGVSKRQRRSYKAWQEGNRFPAFVLEITSFSTRKQDEEAKPRLYEQLGIQEYFQFDPTGDYLNPPLKGQRLVQGHYQPIPTQVLSNGKTVIASHSLGLELHLEAHAWGPSTSPWQFRFYDPVTGIKLLNFDETEQARETAEQARETAEQARETAEQARDTLQRSQQEAIPRLLALGLTPDQVAEALSLSVAEVQDLGSRLR